VRFNRCQRMRMECLFWWRKLHCLCPLTHTHTHTHDHNHTHISTDTHRDTHTRTNTNTHTHTKTQKQTQKHTHTNTYTHTYTYKRTRAHTKTHKSIHVHIQHFLCLATSHVYMSENLPCAYTKLFYLSHTPNFASAVGTKCLWYARVRHT